MSIRALPPVPGWKFSPHQDVIDQLRGQAATRLSTTATSGAQRDAAVHRVVTELLDEHARTSLAAGRMPLDPPVEAQVAAAIRDAFSGLGPLANLLADKKVTNIFLNGPAVWVTYLDGTKKRVPPLFSSKGELVDRIRDIAARAGTDERRFDRGVPRVSVRLPDGSRLFATLLSREPAVAIRRHTLLDVDLDILTRQHAVMHPTVTRLLHAMVRARKNVVICGGPATGKTTFLRACAKAIPPWERLVTIEDTDELALDLDPAHPDCVALQAREPNVEGEGGIDLAELVRWGLRMSPDRVILGEARGGEVVPMLNCMSQGTNGSMTTIHTSTSAQAFTKLMTYAAQSAERLPFEATAPLIGTAVHFVIHLAWSTDGVRVVSSVREVVDADHTQVISNEILRPGGDRRATPAAPLRPDTLDELAVAGFDPDLLAGW
ncbi:CpaF family protein [Phytohabitans aurantiacus]|uniref:Protein kinase n=1 Tax=Phytohabitans aurantiacus TaxID=3016789 RepID=A0ABQ5QW73_9ACTN|nr:ATPase, T2SS/T4P/T4SS family [Phytohabitans aurantiacus]GLH98816.1 protein kinase [Phytohabitans aurantiacus]